MGQTKQDAWHKQWELFKDDETFLFADWIYPNTLTDFKDKEVLECGCGGGQHTAMIAPFAKHITAVDLNTADLARERNRQYNNISFLNEDIGSMGLSSAFDIVLSIGVVHHTDDPDKTVENLKKHLKPGGKLILWVYSKEGNALMRMFIEPFRRMFLKSARSGVLTAISRVLTILLYAPVYSIYLLPLKKLPYYEYFQNFRKLSFQRNLLNVYDKLNAPQTVFIEKTGSMDGLTI